MLFFTQLPVFIRKEAQRVLTRQTLLKGTPEASSYSAVGISVALAIGPNSERIPRGLLQGSSIPKLDISFNNAFCVFTKTTKKRGFK